MYQLIPLLVFSLLSSCTSREAREAAALALPAPASIESIPVPPGCHRLTVERNSAGAWLRQLPLKKDNRVFLYNGALKRNQSAQFAVIDIPIGDKDLQQCADAIMRLHAEYLLANGKENDIRFTASDGTRLAFADWKRGRRFRLAGNRLVAFDSRPGQSNTEEQLEAFLVFAFMYCGTASLVQDSYPVNIMQMRIGDFFLEAGAPGHAMLVVDMAQTTDSQKRFLLAQSYMPAQDIHIVKNAANDQADPWYAVDSTYTLNTPEWTFRPSQLRRWK